ncbi:hypothetical protein D3C81_1768220 [compost metagenome]
MRGELDHRHGAADGLEQALALVLLHDPLTDVGCHLDHAGYLALFVEHRHVAGLQPNLAAGLVEAFERTADRLALAQFTPQLLVLGSLRIARFAE